MRMRAFLLCVVVSACLGQEFEVVSIKPNKTMSGGSQSNTNQGMLRGTNLSLKNLIVRGYGIRGYQLEGPDWLDSERFDISAKFPADFPKEKEKYAAAYQAMMQKMLADRFKLAVHRDQKSMAVYGLVVGKGGIKFKEVAPGHSSSNSNNTHYVGTSISMDAFATFLSGRMELPVLDMTGLKGTYDLTLDWITERQAKADSEPQTGQPIQDAIQDQLGLKVEHRKAPIDIVIVDHAEKIPTEN
jgi:uncharacterized protein (TIGR03435 family)